MHQNYQQETDDIGTTAYPTPDKFNNTMPEFSAQPKVKFMDSPKQKLSNK